jgi:hypothetical protein
LRCPRAAAFENESALLVRDYKKNLAEAEGVEKSKLLESETKEKLRQLFSDMLKAEDGGDDEEEVSSGDFDSLLKDDQTLKAMMDTYFQIEELSSTKAFNLFGGQVISGVRKGETVIGQRIINLFKDGLNFYSFVDTYQEDEKFVRIIESKSTTSRKYANLGPSINKEIVSIFEQSPEGILYLKEENPNFIPFDKYYDNRAKLLDRIGDIGRYVYDLAWQRYVIDNSKHDAREYRYYLSVLNKDYRFDGRHDANDRNVYDPDALIVLIDLTRITQEMQMLIDQDFRNVIDRLNHPDRRRVELEQSKCLIGKGYRECPWLKICNGDYKVPAKNSVYVYLGGHVGFGPGDKSDDKWTREQLIAQGIVNALQVDYDWLSDTQKVQYRVIQSQRSFIEKEFIDAMLNDLHYPLFHLDFETMNYPLPMYEGEAPYQQSVFQYSLHIERKSGICDKDRDSISFLSTGRGDDRLHLIKSMIENIPEEAGGTVIVYNQSFEKGRLKELAEMFPEYRVGLESIRERVFDLMHFIKPNGQIRKTYALLKKDPGNIAFYSEDLQRSYSIKKVLPIFAPHLNYANLQEVHNGIEAQVAFMRLKNLTGKAFDKTYRNMLDYCKQDTWAMVEVLKGLRELVAK